MFYNIGSTINATKPDANIIGLGFPTLMTSSGNVTMSVADVSGVNISGLIFDAGAEAGTAATGHLSRGLPRPAHGVP